MVTLSRADAARITLTDVAAAARELDIDPGRLAFILIGAISDG